MINSQAVGEPLIRCYLTSLTLSCSRANKKPEKFQRQKGGGGPFWSLCVSIQECEKMFCVRSEGGGGGGGEGQSGI
jgi:hypothetical protein